MIAADTSVCLPEPVHSAPLGTITKSSDISGIKTNVCKRTGEAQRLVFSHKKGDYVPLRSSAEARHGRFILQRVAASLLPGHRVASCLHSLTSSEKGVKVHLDKAQGRAFFSGLRVCGNIWACPVCAAKVSERRKLEVRQAVDAHIATGNAAVMVTLTFPHKQHDKLSDLMACLRQAVTKMGMSYPIKTVRRALEVVGTIRALEVTHGRNGWHPHFHIIWLLGVEASAKVLTQLRNAVYAAWSESCRGAGLPDPSEEHGVNVILAESAADYLAKWGHEPIWEAGSELTKAHSKMARDKASSTPFDLLRRAGNGDKKAGELFSEFVQAFKGWRQLFWSPGLKKRFEIVDYTDEELAVVEQGEASELGMISHADWRRLTVLRYDLRSVVLTLAESGGWPAVERFISSLPTFLNHSVRTASVRSSSS